MQLLVPPIFREPLVSLLPSDSLRLRLADITDDHALLQVVEEPPDIGPEEEGNDHHYNWKSNLPKEHIAVVVHRGHGLKVHALEEGSG